MNTDIRKAVLIGKSRIEAAGNQVRLACDISIEGDKRTMFFAVDASYRDALTIGRADPFLAVMINYAMRTNRDVICEEPVSETMLFSLRRLYIPALSYWSDAFSSIQIEATAASEPVKSQNAVGAAMSFGCDSLYTFFRHGKNSEYPITHLCNFNNGVYGDAESFASHTKLVAEFAAAHSLKAVAVDTNIHIVLPERFLDVYSQRNMACVLALQGLFGTYLYSSGHDEEHVAVNPGNSAYYDTVTIEAFSTDSLSFILSGCETTRVGKLRVLCDSADARAYLHPCFKNPIGTKNCGHCKKDVREMILFYAWGVQDKFADVYDWTDFEKKLPMNLAILMSMADDHLYGDVLEEYKKSGKPIPKQSYVYAEVYKKALHKS